MACSGDPRYLCGAGNLLSLYRWTGTPLYTWHTPSGNDAGKYQLLIGGVVVPLITSQTVTGKVTFLEKHGTSLAANSTGAFELDVSKVNDFSSAWRTMNGLKTDVFCSAGLTLPDKAGRQINIGGWSLTSTFGVRLYWPGGPTNDWQENVNELTLQNGRWYPSAMQMTNGSILVVGGESGSNGPPVPTLEILPNPVGGSVMTLDFLNRTDPYNLYPFLAVLPSGGIFIAYYNEARILDERTFATTKELPNIPGAVNNFEGGRTYPLEGTAVLMPPHATYSTPLRRHSHLHLRIHTTRSPNPQMDSRAHALTTRNALHRHPPRRDLPNPQRRAPRRRRLRSRQLPQPERAPLRPLPARGLAHLNNGQHDRRPPVPLRSDPPIRRPRHGLRFRPRRQRQPGRIPHRSLRTPLPALRPPATDLQHNEQRLVLRRHHPHQRDKQQHVQHTRVAFGRGIEHARQQHGSTDSLPRRVVLRNDMHDHGAAERARVSARVVPAIRAGRADAEPFDVCADWRGSGRVGQVAEL